MLVTRPKELNPAQRILTSQLAAIDGACSRFRDDSELSALNRADGYPITVSALFAGAIDVALRAAAITDGDVDPTCGRSLVRLGYDRDYAMLAEDTSALTQPAEPAAGWRCVEFDAERQTVRLPAGTVLDLGATAKALAADLAARRHLAPAWLRRAGQPGRRYRHRWTGTGRRLAGRRRGRGERARGLH